MKKIGLIMDNLIAAEEYRNELYSVLGGSVTIDIISFSNYRKDLVSDVDLFVLHNNYLTKELDIHIKLPMGIPLVDIRLDYTIETIERLKQYPNGTRCILMNATDGFTTEAMLRLYQLGIRNIEWIPYSHGSSFLPEADMLITPGEEQVIPDNIRDRYPILDIGRRKLSPAMIEEIIRDLHLEYIFTQRDYQNYIKQFMPVERDPGQVVADVDNINSGIQELGSIVAEGVATVNEFGKIIGVNQRFAELLNVVREDVIGQIAWEYNEEIFGTLKQFATTGAITKRVSAEINGRKFEVNFYPLVSSGEYRGSIVLMNEKKKRSQARQVDTLGHEAKYRFEDIVGSSLDGIKEEARKMAAVDAAVLIEGETGTGKEMFANAIHLVSSRRNYPFVAINCSALPEELLESELFGYEEGAFTGARKSGKSGLFELADGGTLLLDEIEDMTPRMQSSILRAIQEKKIMRVGGNRLIPVDVRIISSTNQSLARLKNEGKFRKDLFYRLAALHLKLPPLRERPGDLEELIRAYMEANHQKFEISPELMEEFRRFRWEGNVRQLFNCLDFFECLKKPVIEPDDYPYEEEYAEPVPENEDRAFVLDQIYQAHEERKYIGRKGIADAAEEEGRTLTEGQIRRILKELEEDGLVVVGKGRAGSRLTKKGLKRMEEIAEL
ncbi:MAG: sigma 54-interacting transcriptional regulator [Anaerovoracaceae bacterium]|jgi:transcriptional regulator with PAS, ATPase and Fis domain